MYKVLKYMVISERQRYRYVANKGTLHLDHIYLDVMRSVIEKLWEFGRASSPIYIDDLSALLRHPGTVSSR